MASFVPCPHDRRSFGSTCSYMRDPVLFLGRINRQVCFVSFCRASKKTATKTLFADSCFQRLPSYYIVIRLGAKTADKSASRMTEVTCSAPPASHTFTTPSGQHWTGRETWGRLGVTGSGGGGQDPGKERAGCAKVWRKGDGGCATTGVVLSHLSAPLFPPP